MTNHIPRANLDYDLTSSAFHIYKIILLALQNLGRQRYIDDFFGIWKASI